VPGVTEAVLQDGLAGLRADALALIPGAVLLGTCQSVPLVTGRVGEFDLAQTIAYVGGLGLAGLSVLLLRAPLTYSAPESTLSALERQHSRAGQMVRLACRTLCAVGACNVLLAVLAVVSVPTTIALFVEVLLLVGFAWLFT
jgi:hypothetical protein